MSDLSLRELDEGDQGALDRAIAEFAAADPSWSFAFGYAPGADYAAFLARMRQLRAGVEVPADRVQSTLLAALEERRRQPMADRPAAARSRGRAPLVALVELAQAQV